MNGQRKVLHVLGRMNRGGAELRTFDVSRAVDPRQFCVDFCALSGLPGELDEDIAAYGGQVHLASLNPSFPLRFPSLLRREGYHVVHSHVHYFSGAILRLAARAGVPVRIAHFRSTSDGREDSWVRRAQRHLARNWIDRYATRILAVSEAAMASAWGADWHSDPRCTVLYNGLNPAPFWATYDRDEVLREFGWPCESRLWIHVGNLREAKNHAKLLSVFSLLADADVRARLLLVGQADTPLGTFLGRRIDDLGLRDKIVMCGIRTDVPRLLSAADGMIFPSLREGLPGAVLEACAAGVPVLASDLPGIMEIARHFPSVECLPSSASDEQWAQRAGLLPERRLRTVAAAETARAAFAQSPFGIQTCVGLHGQIWGSDTAAPDKAAA